MKKIHILFFSVILMSCTVLKAQAPNSKWISVLDLPNQTVYMDTSSLKQFENQISVLILTVYREPQLIGTINKKVSQVKSQIFFITSSRKYSTVGQLYYDKDLKILGEMSQPGFASNNDNFSSQLEGNVIMTAVFTRSFELLNHTEPPAAEKALFRNSPADNTPAVPQAPKNEVAAAGKGENKILENIGAEKVKEPVKETAKEPVKEPVKETAKEHVKEPVKEPIHDAPNKPKTARPEKDPSIKIIGTGTVKETNEPAQAKSINKSEPAVTQQYNGEKESNPVSSIFTDGSKYSFQVSSWRIKSKAESEAEKLKKEGHSSFITEAVVKGKTWYRVRIGYFNSLAETESYMKKVK
jgi:cell division protein FtsN